MVMCVNALIERSVFEERVTTAAERQRRTRDTHGVLVSGDLQRRCPAGLFARNVNWADQRVAGLAKIETNKMRDFGGCVAASNNHGFVVADFGYASPLTPI